MKLVSHRPPRLRMWTRSVPHARPVAEVRAPLLRLRPSSVAFETGPGFLSVDGQETYFMLDQLFELKLIDGIWQSSGKSPLSDVSSSAIATMEDTSSSFTERLRRVAALLSLPEGFPLFTYMGYSAARFFEDLPNMKVESGMPEIVLRVYRYVIRYGVDRPGAEVSILKTSPNRATGSADIMWLLANPPEDSLCKVKPEQTGTTDLTDKARFFEGVDKAKEHILAGDIYQVQLSRKAVSNAEISPIALFDRLARFNPAPYMFYADLGEQHLISASPELFVRCQERRTQVRPIAGTMPHGNGGASALGAIPKEAAEHLMLVDLARNDLARCAVPGSLDVPSLMSEERYGPLMHLVSTVEADTDLAHDVWDVLKANFPAGTMTGAPKIRAMEVISELEDIPRGAFTGCVGCVTGRNSAVFALTIRTITGNRGAYFFQAAAGVVADSSAEAEWRECGAKIQSFARVMETNV